MAVFYKHFVHNFLSSSFPQTLRELCVLEIKFYHISQAILPLSFWKWGLCHTPFLLSILGRVMGQAHAILSALFLPSLCYPSSNPAWWNYPHFLSNYAWNALTAPPITRSTRKKWTSEQTLHSPSANPPAVLSTTDQSFHNLAAEHS